jgi:hypothetical protein
MESQRTTSRVQSQQPEQAGPSDRLLLLAVGASALWVLGWIGIQISGRLG